MAVTGFVTPRMVRSPSSSAVPSSAIRMSVERKVMVGVFSTSKKSSASRWSLNRGSSMTIERASAEPVSTPSASCASTLSKLLRNVARPLYLTPKPKLEWTGSRP